MKAVARIVEDNRIGVTARGDTDEAFAAAVEALFADRERLPEDGKNSLLALKDRNLWIHRARQVVSDLGEKRA